MTNTKTQVTLALQDFEVPWYSHTGGNTVTPTIRSAWKNTSWSFSRQQSMLTAILDNQKKIMDHHGISGYNPGTWQV